VWCYPNAIVDHEDPTGSRGLVVRGLGTDVWVDADGRRFHDESRRGGASGTPALLAQPASTCWCIVDARGIAHATLGAPRFGVHPTPDRARIDAFLAASADVRRVQSIEELPAAIGEFNGWIREGRHRDPEFCRPLTGLRPIETAPFTALRFRPLARKALGGVRTDLACRVLDRAGDLLPGLYAAGEVAGMAGGHINGLAALEGTMLGPSLYSGRIAGRSAARIPIV
jgi:predicted oxidoreductase